MPRKKAFSSKQKKEQLQLKRRRKLGANPGDGRGRGRVAESEDSDSGAEHQDCAGHNVDRINFQPHSQSARKHDPNRYRLHFFKQKDEDVAAQKQRALHPYQCLPETCLEVDYDPGVVIDIPKRPQWDYSLTKERLEINEARYFQSYLDGLFGRDDVDKLGYTELNLETWRQLWRTLEMSDIFLFIADIRHPIVNFSAAAYTYITEDLNKSIILILNKVDIAPPALVVAWQQYFKTKFPKLQIVCFTSFPKTREELENMSEGIGKVVFKRRRRGTYRALGPPDLYKACLTALKDQVDLSSWARKIDEDQGLTQGDSSEDDEEGPEIMGDPEITATANGDHDSEERPKAGILTIGCIGYPNVGKSSVINGLMGKKVVSVSRTPGHTKHFQTIYLTHTVRLCDSPGLVFPSYTGRQEQILGGIFPVAQVREPYSSLQYMAERLDLPRLLRLDHPDQEVDRNCPPWTAMDICEAWAVKRGFLTARTSRPDTYRAANHLLRLTVEGRLCLCRTPPGYTQAKACWESHPDVEKFIELQSSCRQTGQQAAANTGSEHDDSSDNDDDGDNQDHESGKDNETKKKSFTSANMFALLGDSD